MRVECDFKFRFSESREVGGNCGIITVFIVKSWGCLYSLKIVLGFLCVFFGLRSLKSWFEVEFVVLFWGFCWVYFEFVFEEIVVEVLVCIELSRNFRVVEVIELIDIFS